ncbi:LuxR C-terminal-related transcriptional regulator [Serratia sp. 2723]|uniref:LuxR C-terminal-related transcriptional regulator n=1 Tax=unclassified Serratia (in: enterobacteria) TaxID=2647522 RepID=UPI003D2098B0
MSAIENTANNEYYYQERYRLLTARERDVLIDTLNGTNVNVTAHRLKLSTKTIYAHKTNAFKKIGVRKIQDILHLKDLIFEKNKQMMWIR